MIAWEYFTKTEAIEEGRDPNKLIDNTIKPDHIIEVEPTGPTSGEIVWEWHAYNHLDLNRFSPVTPEGDWLHMNSIAPIPENKWYDAGDKRFKPGNIIIDKNADERMEPASLTKMMTAYLVLGEIKSGRISLSDTVRISEKAWRMEGSRTFVKEGDRVPVETLMKGMIVQFKITPAQ